MLNLRLTGPHRAYRAPHIRRSLVLSACLPFYLALATAPALAQRGSTTTQTRPVCPPPSLEARLDKATRIYNAAVAAANSYPVFWVQGKVVASRGNRIVVYGVSVGGRSTGVGWNGEDTYLTVYNVDLNTIQGGHYNVDCVALSQTEFTPPPPLYFQALAVAHKYGPIVESIQSEIAARDQGRQQQVAARVATQENARRDSVLQSRRALLAKERTASFARGDALLASATDAQKPHQREEEAMRLLPLFNKWAALGADDGVIVSRIVRDLLTAGTLRAKQGDLGAACAPVEQLLSLELQRRQEPDPQTARAVVVLSVGKARPSAFTLGLLHSRQNELSEVSALADAWLKQLPGYMRSSAPQSDKARVAALSQVLVTQVFARQPDRLRVVGAALESLREYPNGTVDTSTTSNRRVTAPPSAVVVDPVVVDPALRESVEEARSEGVASQVKSFLQAQEDATRSSTDPLVFHRFASQARALSQTLAPRDESASLDKAVVVAGLRAATLWARQGRLGEAMVDARSALWEPGTTWKTVGGLKQFSPDVQLLMGNDASARQVLGELMVAWTGAYPAYVKGAQYVDSLLARKFGEILLRCSDDLSLPEKTALEAVLKQPITATTWKPGRNRARVAYCAAPEEEAPDGDANEGDAEDDGGVTAAAPQTDAGAKAPPPQPVPALNFVFNSFLTGRKSKLSDFRGKVVIVDFFDIDSERAHSPTPEEQLFEFSKKYDPKKVVLLLLNTSRLNDYLMRSFQEKTRLAKQMGNTPLVLPKEIYAYDDSQRGDQDNYSQFERAMGRFYEGSNTLDQFPPRVTVIDPAGMVIGHTDFEYEDIASQQLMLGGERRYQIFDLDADALDSLVIEALTPQGERKSAGPDARVDHNDP